MEVMTCDEIVPGTSPSYEICKIIYEYHPLGGKLVDYPIKLAQSQSREITIIDAAPEDRLRDAFLETWQTLRCDDAICNTVRLKRVYGVSSLALLVDKQDHAEPLDLKTIANPDVEITFNVYDPLNTAGSLVLNQNPLAMDFLKPQGAIRVSGQIFHRSRCSVALNEDPIYIGYTTSAFGYVGRSVYQRGLFPLKSYLQTMLTNDMIAQKAGAIVAKMKSLGSIISEISAKLFGQKREMLREAKTGNVLSIGIDESLESLDLKNLEAPFALARNNIKEDIAAAAGMPAQIINSQTFAQGFGEGSEDAKAVAHYIDDLRIEMEPQYEFCTRIAQYRAWNKEFFKTLVRDFPETYAGVSYEEAFYEWRRNFRATWPNFLTEPESEKAKWEESRNKSLPTQRIRASSPGGFRIISTIRRFCFPRPWSLISRRFSLTSRQPPVQAKKMMKRRHPSRAAPDDAWQSQGIP